MRPPAVIPASYSSISAYETCPKQFYHLRIAKDVKQEESKEMAWGNLVHKKLEEAIKFGRSIPGNMEAFQWGLSLCQSLAVGRKINAEMDIAVTRDHVATGFWDGDAWVRGKLDVLIHDEAKTYAVSIDHKTGKTKPNSQQLLLSTLMCFDNYQTLERVKTAFFWLPEPDHAKRITQQLFIRHDSDTLQTTDTKGKQIMLTMQEAWEPFVDTIEQMEWSLQHDTWPAKPSGLCKAWCPVLSCPHNGKRT